MNEMKKNANIPSQADLPNMSGNGKASLPFSKANAIILDSEGDADITDHSDKNDPDFVDD
jgi:hypothetical protein